ncbi:MAG: formylmethanofuran dehydrogenase subunit C [Methanotrichaceae archaeon]|nr:formylmethanofuran dehydrogenase subunit C [Methanotrichaceae archaeon]
MTEILLRSKGSIGIMVEAEVIIPDIFAGKKKEEIEGLIVWQGPFSLPLAEFFDVDVRSGAGLLEDTGSDGTRPDETSILIEGDVSRVKRIGQGMKAGRIEIHGSAGMHLGAEMTGGSILVRGDAGSWAGREMKGGLLHIAGSAADHIGSAYRGSWRGMTGGEIRIDGSARSQLGGGLVGGQIVVAGNVENFCGIRQSGGLIVVKGSAMRGVGAEMNGGTIAVCGDIRQFSPGFIETGHEENVKLGDMQLEGLYAKFTGDYALGKNPKGSLYCREG